MVKFRSFFYFTKKEIDTSFKNAKLAAKMDGLKLLQAPTERDFGKLLVIIPKKSGKAHDRNLFKRRTKAIFYEEKLYQKPSVFILLVYKNAMKLSFEELRDFLVKAIK